MNDLAFKRPESALVLVHTTAGKVLLLKRRDRAGFWQSVTGSLAWDEPNARDAAQRELLEETGIDAGERLRDLGLTFRYEIFPEWRARYAADVTHNDERVYALELPRECEVRLSDEHVAYAWVDAGEALTKVSSWSNREAIRAATAPSGEAVVLVHGLWLSGWAMALLARWLRAAGFRPYRFSYASVQSGLMENAQRLRAFSDGINARVIHYVGHSLGGVVIQTMLSTLAPPTPGRIVTLGSPHQGSIVATRLARYRWGRRLLGRGVVELAEGKIPAFQSGGRDIGVIKGTRSFGLGRFVTTITDPNDGVVLGRESHWPGATELALPVAHTEMLCSSELAENVVEFLKSGHFKNKAD